MLLDLLNYLNKMQQDNPKWIVLCAFEINYFPGALYFSAIFTA